MLAIRLKPIGRRHQKHYRVVVVERSKKLNGKYTEDLGFYNPHLKEVGVNKERAQYWIGVGAQPSDTVHNLFVSEKIIDAPKRAKHTQSKKDPVEEAPKAPAAEAPAEEAAPAEEEAPQEEAPAAEEKTEEAAE